MKPAGDPFDLSGDALTGAGRGVTVVSTQHQTQIRPRCTLCPAGCELDLAPAGPDRWRSEYPTTAGAGLCPRGSAVGELLTHPRRIVSAGRGGKPIDLQTALQTVVETATDGGMVLLLEGNLPCEQIAAAGAWVARWDGAKLCLVLEPAEEQLLAGTESSGAPYLTDDELSGCDGFVIIGDAFSANPRCARGVFDRRRDQPRTPIVVIDPAVGASAKFATRRVDVAPGQELAAAKALSHEPVLSHCRRLGVLIAAECGRTSNWGQIGLVAGQLAAARGGGLSVQTTGTNALAAFRLAARLGTISLDDALASSGVRIAIGCDVTGMLGRDAGVFAAAAAVPDRTTAGAKIVLPLALPFEGEGTYLPAGKPERIAAVMAAPAGVPQPGELVAMLAAMAGVAGPIETSVPEAPRVTQAPVAEATSAVAAGTALLLGRQAIHAGCGALTQACSWQVAAQPKPELRISPGDALAAGIDNLAEVTVRANGHSVVASVRLAPELPDGRVVLPEGCPGARALLNGSSEPIAVELSA